MMNLTRTAKKAYLGLVLTNFLIVFSLLQLHSYYNDYLKPAMSPEDTRTLVRLVKVLQKNTQEKWTSIIKTSQIPWLELDVSAEPHYQDNALLNIQPYLISAMLREDEQPAFSVFLDSKKWLNVSINPPFQPIHILFYGFLLVFLVFIFLINYLAIRALDQPLQTIIESLNDTQIKENWSPIPLTGSPEQQLIIKSINELQKKVHTLLANRTKVVTAISHDLRTPLTRLKLRVENLQDELVYEKLMNDINEMELMIRDTLNYFQDIHNTEQLLRFDFVSLIHSIKEDMEDTGASISFLTKSRNLVYTGAVNLLRRALINILTNAIHYGNSAQIVLVNEAKEVRIVISDKGPGLSDEELTQMYSPFYRGEKSRSRTTGGVGLGLTISKEIIEMHKGSIIALNSVYGGLEVTITLPK